MSKLRQLLAVAAGALLLAGTAQAAEVFTITSSAFKDGQLLPKKMAGDNKANPNCVGENVSPALSWTNVPAGTTSFALVMTDPEGRGTGVDHWIAYGIPASVTSFAECETSKPSDKYVGGIGNMIMMFHGGDLPTEDVKDSLRRFARDVMPRLKERFPTRREAKAA